MSDARKQLIREAILAELDRRKKTRYWLAAQIGVHPNLVNRSLSEGYDMRVSTAEKMLRALDLDIRPR